MKDEMTHQNNKVNKQISSIILIFSFQIKKPIKYIKYVIMKPPSNVTTG